MITSIATDMERQLQRQRREPYIWRRFLDKPNPHPRLKLVEEPNQDIFMNIMSKHLDEMPSEHREKMRQMKGNMEEAQWSKKVFLSQKEFTTFPASYGGCKQIGRSYGSSITFIPSKIVNTLYSDTHRYLDFVSCFPTILCGAFQHLDTPAIKLYMTNKDEICQSFYREHGITASEIKEAFNAIQGASPKLPSDCGLGPGKEHKVHILSEHPMILDWQKEFIMITMDIKERYPDFYAGMCENARIEGKSDHQYGRVLHYFCADIEDAMMRTTIKLLQDGHDDDLAHNFVLKFDGALFPKSTVYDEDEAIHKIQAAIYDEHGLHMRIAFKDMSSYRYTDCGVDILVNAYEKWKKNFDKKWCKFLNPDKYGYITSDGTYNLVGYGQSGAGGTFGFMNAEDNEDFIKRWVTDPTKIIYQGMDFAPPPLQSKEGYLNTFRGFAASRDLSDMEDDEIQKRVEMWKRHVNIMAGNKDEYAAYLHKLIAHIIQKPGEKTGVCVFIRSIQGTGKDQFFKMLSSIVGHSMCHTASNMDELMNKTSILQNKLLLCISEVSYKDFKAHNEEIKHMITREVFTVKHLYQNPFVDRLLVNIFMFTNSYGGMSITMDDRRYFMLEADGTYAADPVYHEPFNDYIMDKDNQVAVFRWYKAMDIEGFRPMSERPVTHVQKLMASQTSNHMAFFLKEILPDWILWASPNGREYRMISDQKLRITASAFNEAFKMYCEKMKMNNLDTARKVESYATQLLQEAAASWRKYTPQGVDPYEIVKGPKGVRLKIFYVPAIQEWISNVAPDYEAVEEGLVEEPSYKGC